MAKAEVGKGDLNALAIHWRYLRPHVSLCTIYIFKHFNLDTLSLKVNLDHHQLPSSEHKPLDSFSCSTRLFVESQVSGPYKVHLNPHYNIVECCKQQAVDLMKLLEHYQI